MDVIRINAAIICYLCNVTALPRVIIIRAFLIGKTVSIDCGDVEKP